MHDLAKIIPDKDIANILNRLRKTTGKGNSWTEVRIRSFRSYQGIPVFCPQNKEKEGWLTMAETAEYLDISAMSVRRLIQKGIIPAKQIVPYAPWLILKKDLQNEAIQEQVRAMKCRDKRPLTEIPGQQKLDYSGM